MTEQFIEDEIKISKKRSNKVNKTLSLDKGLNKKIVALVNHKNKNISALFTDFVNSEYEKMNNGYVEKEVKNEIIQDQVNLVGQAFNQILDAIEDKNSESKTLNTLNNVANKLSSWEKGNLDMIMDLKNEVQFNTLFMNAYIQYSIDADKEKFKQSLKNIENMKKVNNVKS